MKSYHICDNHHHNQEQNCSVTTKIPPCYLFIVTDSPHAQPMGITDIFVSHYYNFVILRGFYKFSSCPFQTFFPLSIISLTSVLSHCMY